MAKEKEQRKTTGIGIIVKTIFFIIAIFLLIISCTIVYKANKYPDKVPDIFGYKPMIVLSGSMETEIYTGDLVFVKIVDPTTLKENDIVAFRNEDDRVTTHRIVEMVEENGQTYFRTKGDNNKIADANLVAMKDIEGIYVTRLAGVGNALIFIQQPIGLAVILLIILVVGLIWLYIVDKMDERKFEKDNEQDRLEFEEYRRKKREEEQRQQEEKKQAQQEQENKEEQQEEKTEE